MTAGQLYSLIRTVPPVLEDWDFSKDTQGLELFPTVRFVLEQFQASQRYSKLTVAQRAALRRRLDLAALRLVSLIEYFDSNADDVDEDDRALLATANSLFMAIGQQLDMSQQQLQAYCDSRDMIALLHA
jgi:hypothetical protein